MSKIKRPIGKFITKSRAVEICSDWHDGQRSALYSFASSKTFSEKRYGDYIAEIKRNKPDTAKGKAELKSLKRFFDLEHWKANQ